LDLLIGVRPSEIVAFEHPAIATDAPSSDPTAAILARDQLRIQFRADERAIQRLVNAVAVDDMFLSVRRLSVRRAEDEHRRDRIFEILIEQVARTGPSINSTTHAPQPAAWIPAAWTTPPEHEYLFASPAAPTVGSILEMTLEPRAHVSDPDTDARISELPPTPRTRPRVRVGAWIETPRGLRAVLVRAADDAARVVTAGERIEAWQVLVKEIRANPFRAVLRDETDGSEIEIREESLSPP
jgi:hypothetical protein